MMEVDIRKFDVVVADWFVLGNVTLENGQLVTFAFEIGDGEVVDGVGVFGCANEAVALGTADSVG